MVTRGARKPPDPPAGLNAACPNDWLPVWRRVRASPAVKLVGVMAYSFADWADGSSIHPGTEILSVVCGLSGRAVGQALADIRDWGLLWRYVEGSKYGRRGVADAYRLTIPGDILDGRVPLLTPDYELAEQVASAGLIPAGTPELRSPDLRSPDLSDRITRTERQEHPNSVRPTSTSTSTYTQTYNEGPAGDASVEVSRNGAALVDKPDIHISPSYRAEPRRACPECGLDTGVMPGGALRVHGPRYSRCRGSRTRPQPWTAGTGAR